MVEITTTNITASTISEIFYIPDLNGNIDVYIPITASSISDESNIYLIGEDVDDWCHNISFMYARYQPQGNVWFLHLTLDRYDYDINSSELQDRTVGIHIELITKPGSEPIIIDHQVIQNGCERDDSETCVFEFCFELSSIETKLTQDCTLVNEIIEKYGGTKTHVLTQDC
jgi:hypothetical protein